MTTFAGYEVTRLNRPQVVQPVGETMMVFPKIPVGTFNTVLHFCKINDPVEHVAGSEGDIYTFRPPLADDDAALLSRVMTNSNPDCHRPATMHELREQMQLARIVTGATLEN